MNKNISLYLRAVKYERVKIVKILVKFNDLHEKSIKLYIF